MEDRCREEPTIQRHIAPLLHISRPGAGQPRSRHCPQSSAREWQGGSERVKKGKKEQTTNTTIQIFTFNIQKRHYNITEIIIKGRDYN